MEKSIDKSLLRDNCDKIEEMRYMRRFTPEQIRDQKNELAEVSIQISDLQAEKKEMTKGFNEQIKPLADVKTNLLVNIKQKAEFVTEDCYKFIDHEANQVGWYSPEGDLIEQRPSYPEEMQIKIPFRKTGTND